MTQIIVGIIAKRSATRAIYKAYYTLLGFFCVTDHNKIDKNPSTPQMKSINEKEVLCFLKRAIITIKKGFIAPLIAGHTFSFAPEDL